MSQQLIGKRFQGQADFSHGRAPTIGVLLVNLGTPDAPTKASVKQYLAEFLADKRVVEIPHLLWLMILHGIILRFRPAKSVKAYQKVWTDRGSPLMTGTRDLADHLKHKLETAHPNRFSVKIAMRYGQPAIREELQALQAAGAERLMVVPLYPQYSGATIGTVADTVFKELSTWRWIPELQVLGTYHDDNAYLAAIADSLTRHWRAKGHTDDPLPPGHKLLISFHGMPKFTLTAGDPYFCHCHKTARLLAERLNLREEQWEMAFQSRFGKAEWLQPYVSPRFEALPSEGVKHLTVICPGFAVDCLETLEEIAMDGKHMFMAAGGDHFDYVPALNASVQHANFFAKRISHHASAWLAHNTVDDDRQKQQLQDSLHRAISAGAA